MQGDEASVNRTGGRSTDGFPIVRVDVDDQVAAESCGHVDRYLPLVVGN
jgi:hypothetical protein